MEDTNQNTPQKKKLSGGIKALIVIAIIVVVVAIGVIGSALGGGTRTPTNPLDNQSTGGTAQKTGYEVSDINYFINNIEAFMKEFDENAVAAEEKYKDKIVQFTGYVGSVDTDILNHKFVTLKSSADELTIVSVQCYFSGDNESQITSLKKGDKAIIVGKVTGHTINVSVEDCEVLQESLQPAQ